MLSPSKPAQMLEQAPKWFPEGGDSGLESLQEWVLPPLGPGFFSGGLPSLSDMYPYPPISLGHE